MIYLSADACCSEFEEGAILLDLRSGSYIGINAANLAQLKRRVANWPASTISAQALHTGDCIPTSHTARDLIDDLLARGILTTSAPVRNRLCTANPQDSLSIAGRATARRSLSARHSIQLLLALISVKLRVRSGRLLPMLNWLERRQRRLDIGTVPSVHQIEALLSAHGRWRIWFYTANNHCLLDSLVLCVFLTNCGIQCTFVIGVATKPFLAHAWVQIGASVVNDTAEFAQMFSPILAVGSAM
jgi:hypothetical protein